MVSSLVRCPVSGRIFLRRFLPVVVYQTGGRKRIQLVVLLSFLKEIMVLNQNQWLSKKNSYFVNRNILVNVFIS